MVTGRKRTEIPCIMCNNAIRFPEYVGQDYTGDLLCDRCRSLLHIKLDKWEVKQYKVLRDRSKEYKGLQKLKGLQETAAKLKYGPEKGNKAGGK
jgi:hypothetical protein